MGLQSVQAIRLVEILKNRVNPRYPEGASAAGKPTADPILAAGMFFCAVGVASSESQENPPTSNALVNFVLTQVTASPKFIDANCVVDLRTADNTNLLTFRTSEGATNAAIFIPSLSQQMGLQGLDAAIFETGIVLYVFAKCLKQSIITLPSLVASGVLSDVGLAFLKGVKALLNNHGDAFGIVRKMIFESAPYAVIANNLSYRARLQAVIKSESVPDSTDYCEILAYRHLLQTAIVSEFVITSLEESIELYQPLADHDAITDAVTHAASDWIVEPARSMLLETVAYSCNRAAWHSKRPEEAVAYWMRGAWFAWHGLISSCKPRLAKYVAENLAQASRCTGRLFGKKCADAIFCGAYTIGHLFSCIYITADQLKLKPLDGTDSTRFTGARDWCNEWEAIPAYKENPFFVHEFMANNLQITGDNLTVNMLAGIILLEQFLRDIPTKRRQVGDLADLPLLTAYIQQPDNLSWLEDRPLLFAEPFLWAYQVFRLALSSGVDGEDAILGCGYHCLGSREIRMVSELLRLASLPPESLPHRTCADLLSGLVSFLKLLASHCPDGTSEKAYLLSLSSELGKIPFTEEDTYGLLLRE